MEEGKVNGIIYMVSRGKLVNCDAFQKDKVGHICVNTERDGRVQRYLPNIHEVLGTLGIP